MQGVLPKSEGSGSQNRQGNYCIRVIVDEKLDYDSHRGKSTSKSYHKF
jgi:hypothetical protein